MNGHVDAYGRALVTVSVRAPSSTRSGEIEAWIDTGFNGELVLPLERIHELKLPRSGTIKALLADGSETALERYLCVIDWFGAARELEVVANEGAYPLLGVGLLVGYDLHVSYRSGNVTVE